MANRIKSVAIIGGGPSGAAVGTLLARQGVKTVLFQAGDRPSLIVGESLVPAVIPYLQDLGVEKEIAGFSVYKPGATISLWPSLEQISFGFGFGVGGAGGGPAPYAYNTPRDLFDGAILGAARRAGVKIIEGRAALKAIDDSVRLDGVSAEAASDFLNGQPDLIVDASGRARVIPRLLKLPTVTGDRKDEAFFAHLDRADLAQEGHIHVDRYTHGWGWRIPLPGRVSVGIVVDARHLGAGSAEERFDRFVVEEPALARFLGGSKRVTGVAHYNNYQLASSRWVGPGWALVGDAAGFIDPIFSTGVFLALRGADRLAKAILNGSPESLESYGKKQLRELEHWKRLISYWYDGRLFTLFIVGRQQSKGPLGRLINPHVTKHVTRIFTGEAGSYSYSRGLLRFMVDHMLAGADPAELAIC